MEVRHVPVMVAEVLEYLRPRRGGVYFDGTVGDGGHSEAILEAGGAAEAVDVIAVDRDPEAIEVARERLARFGKRVRFECANFADAAEHGSATLAGALLDLGVASRHLDARRRGFSYRPGTPLDMRMAGDRAGAATAADLLNELSGERLIELFREYGGERRPGRLVSEIMRRRREDGPFAISDDLIRAAERAYGHPPGPKHKARLFQALRVAVNGELDALERALPALRRRLEAGGVLVALSYHSLEDRRVKHSFREWSRACVCPPELPVCRCRGEPLGEELTRGPRRPSEAEAEANSRARSARLRAWRKEG